MDKSILAQYIDACALWDMAEDDLRKIRKRKQTIVQDSVKGSMHDFPYSGKTFRLEGVSGDVEKMDKEEEYQEALAQKRKDAAMAIRKQVDEWMLTISPRMQRIIRYKVFDNLTWGEVAIQMGRKATADGVRMEFQRFMEDF